jgi:uncharacterized membrane protein YfcA
MLLIIEIILTVIAWIRGWKWRSLIPLGLLVFIGFTVGMILGSLGLDPLVFQPAGIFLDLLGVIALFVMCIVKPKKTG